MSSDLGELLTWADVAVVCHHTTEFTQALAERPRDVSIVDLVSLSAEIKTSAAYTGVCW